MFSVCYTALAIIRTYSEVNEICLLAALLSRIHRRFTPLHPSFKIGGADMPTNGLRKTLDRLRHALAPSELTDGQLLKRFIAERDETAFAALVRRHGSLVMGVARRILGSFHDSEDVFQATFLILAQKAHAVVNRQAIPGWLYTVAYRTALEARARNDRRRRKEKQVEAMPQPETTDPEARDWQPVLDQELSRLPEKYRLPVILCDLEGRPRKEVERHLHLREGTLSSRLATARRLLAQRLTRRGVTLSGGALAMAMSAATAAVPPALVGTTAQQALLISTGQLAAISGSVTNLMKAGAKAMLIAKWKATLATVTVLVALSAGGLVYSGGGQAKPHNDLDALRNENELLKVNLRATLERIRTLETKLGTLTSQKRGDPVADLTKIHAQAGGAAKQAWNCMACHLASKNDPVDFHSIIPQPVQADKAKADPTAAKGANLSATDFALRAYREALTRQDDKAARRHAVDALEKALKSLREQETKRQK
jgi:RNA polymerase sigma factor (sigma-70 family)